MQQKILKLQRKNGVIIINESDYNLLREEGWCVTIKKSRYYSKAMISKGRASGCVSKVLARYIMGQPNGLEVDHIDGNPLNNVRDNLRLCTHANNSLNQGSRTGNSKYKGVHVRKTDNRIMAYISVNGKRKYIGYFKSEKEAAIAYNKEAIILHGEFARLNEVGLICF